MCIRDSPNPAYDIINIETAYGTDHIEGAILSTDGREIKKFKLTSDNIQIDINQLPKGLYYLYFSMSHAWMKFIKI
ncbi:MAG: T9SS type A sorting domain-containing protein, partial [Candidatus Competibacteraceae bacterium]|nr:T9SS type A sorting domain-containing protein [Candidatus Competibacteraceae bacterium]